jgi:hypothetical protein
MPHKHNADRRHHIPKMSFKVQNWPAYEAVLRRRDSLTLWIEDPALECWQTIGPSGAGSVYERGHSDRLDAAHGVQAGVAPDRGPDTSVLSLMGLTISAPDHTTVSRRAATLGHPGTVSAAWSTACIDRQHGSASQWLQAKHGAKSRRTWRKLHLAVDAASGVIVAQTLTDADGPSQVGPLLDQIGVRRLAR